MEAYARGKVEYEPPRYMSINTAAEQLLLVESRRQEGACPPEAMCVGLARLGTDQQLIVSGTLEELREVEFGPPLHSLIIAGHTHVMEDEMLRSFRCTPSMPRRRQVASSPEDEQEAEEDEV